MSTVSTPLKYLWSATYKDGSQFDQPANDRSKNHDDNADWNPSAFRDIDQDNLRSFALYDRVTGTTIVDVDLETGLFNIAGVEFSQEDQNFQPVGNRKLMYFREVRQESVGGVVRAPYINRYFIGWEAKDATGKNHKVMLGIA